MIFKNPEEFDIWLAEQRRYSKRREVILTSIIVGAWVAAFLYIVWEASR